MAASMSTTDAATQPQNPQPKKPSAEGEAPRAKARALASIVPSSTIAGRALVAVVAIMTFLAGLTIGTAVAVRATASQWRSDVTQEVTIQIRAGEKQATDAQVQAAADIARKTPGIADVHILTPEETSRLLEPWLGSGLDLGDLPVPRVIVVKLKSGATPDTASMRKLLTDRVPGATLDDHRGWIDRMRAMADFVVLGGLLVLGLVIAATILSVSFATSGAMAANRPVIEVLHFIGARDRYIAGQFQRHFLWLGLKGGAIGGFAAILTFALIAPIEAMVRGTAGAEQFAALFGSITMGLSGYVVVLLQIALIAAVASESSRRTVNSVIASI